jgi:signal transduction histidine kinase
MEGPEAHHRLLRIAPLGIWALLGIPFLIAAVLRPHGPFPRHFALFPIAFVIFGAAFWTSVRSSGLGLQRFMQIGALAAQSLAVLVMSFVIPEHLIGLFFIFVSWQLALFFRLRIALLWIGIQSFLLLCIYTSRFSLGDGISVIAINVGFQAFAVVTAFVADSEIRARKDLAGVNAELRAARELLAESSRASERLRISRELHDVMGHNLTALSIHLEVAGHLVNGQAAEHLEKARYLSKVLLSDVRGIVSAMKGSEAVDVRRAVQALGEGIPTLQLHLNLPEELTIADPIRAQVFVRCVQEIVTNALRHSDAGNLWVEVTATGAGFEIDAKDDGRGSQIVRLGSGLSTMKARLEEIGGSLALESQPARGFAVRAWLPLAAKVGP